jgi:1,4-dihydroxy-6-naphthoate synthase
MKQELEVTAISMHAYAYLWEPYAILPSGASVGDQYGPLVVSKQNYTIKDLAGKQVAIPGLLTTAFLVLQLLEKNIKPIVMPFDEILPAVVSGKVDVGVIIHEGQLTYQQYGVYKIVDLGEWWYEKTKLPLVLGTNVIRKDLGREAMRRFSRLLRASIEFGLSHRQETLKYALQYGRGMDTTLGDRFIEMYVSPYTVDLGRPGRESVIKMLDWAYREKLIPKKIEVEYVD